MTALAWTVGGILAWFVCGLVAGRVAASRAYATAQKRWPTLGEKTWEEDAWSAYVGSVIGGPLALVADALQALVGLSFRRSVPEVRERIDREAQAAQAARIQRLEAELNEAHRLLGLPPIRS